MKTVNAIDIDIHINDMNIKDDTIHKTMTITVKDIDNNTDINDKTQTR